MSEIHYLTEQDVKIAHIVAVSMFGGSEGIRDPKALASSVAQPQMEISGQETYKGLFKKAAAYAFFLCQNHPFIDGNKRTAALATNIFLNLNGFRINAVEGEISKLFIKIASGLSSIEEIEQWIKQHSERQA